jgi:hypothetical protein
LLPNHEYKVIVTALTKAGNSSFEDWYTVKTHGQKDSGYLPRSAFVGTSIACFIAGALVAFCTTVVAVRRRWLSKFRAHQELSTSEEMVEVSKKYDLADRGSLQATYATIVDTQCQEPSAELTKNPSYLSTAVDVQCQEPLTELTSHPTYLSAVVDVQHQEPSSEVPTNPIYLSVK